MGSMTAEDEVTCISTSSSNCSISSAVESENGQKAEEASASEVVHNALIDSILDRLMDITLQEDASLTVPARRLRVKPAPVIEVELGSEELSQLCLTAVESFARQKTLLRISTDTLPLTVCGDIHGQFHDLRRIFAACGHPSDQNYLFLGDYVDRGVQGIETISLLLCLKVKYPTKVFLLRGNHEDANVTLVYGFHDECVARFPQNEEGELLWHHFVNVFNMIPVAALLADRIFCVHGGLSPFLNDLSDIENICRPTLVPPYGLLCDLLWSDPNYKPDGWALSPRGKSFTFSRRLINEFCDKHGIDMVVRAHQITPEMNKGGYSVFPGGRLITIFSAPNYMNFRNDSCVLHISKNLECCFTVFRPTEFQTVRPEIPNADVVSHE